MSIAWDNSLATGVTLIDDEHKELFRQVANLSQALSEGEGRQKLGKVLDYLGDYVVTHFAHEEKMVGQISSPLVATNLKDHNQLIATFKDMQSRFNKAGTSSILAIEIHDVVTKWLIQHISQIDIPLLASKNVAGKTPALATSK